MSTAPFPPERTPHRLRFCLRLQHVAQCLAACGLALLVSPSARGQVINLSLNVYYDDPGDINSGGSWKLVGKSTDFGIAGINVRLAGINPVVNNVAPRGLVNGSDPAGLAIFEQLVGSYLLTQQPAFPTGTEIESAFYGIGATPNGNPYTDDPGYPPDSFDDLQGVPWGVDDDLTPGFNNSEWDVAADLLSGTFADGMQPGFLTGHTGRVFMTNGTSTTYGHALNATIFAPIVRTNSASADYNDDGFINAADYVAWRKNPSDHLGDPTGYNLWQQHFAESAPGASGGLSAAVPEPATAAWLFFTLVFALCARPRRLASPLAV